MKGNRGYKNGPDDNEEFFVDQKKTIRQTNNPHSSVKGTCGGVRMIKKKEERTKNTSTLTNLKRIFDGPALIEVLALVELVGGPISQAGVETNVLLIVRKGPEGYP